MYLYCYNNPINFVDPSGEFGEAVLEWFLATSWMIAADGLLPIGEAIVLGGCILIGGYEIITSISIPENNTFSILDHQFDVITQPPLIYEPSINTDSDAIVDNIPNIDYSPITYDKKSNPDPYGRPGQKKQGRELKNEARKKSNFRSRNNRRDGLSHPPKHHTPGKTHRKIF